MRISTLRPGLLVSLSTTVKGNVKYSVTEIEAEHATGDGMRRATWQTDKLIVDPVEHDEAIKLRGKARSLVTGICSASSFGLLCPESSRERLDAAVAEAQAIADGFNARASVTRMAVHVIVGRVAEDDAQAVRAINAEVRGLMEAMDQGLRKLDVAAVRDAANRARELSAMLTPEAAGRAQAAIDAARSAARRIVKAGEEAAIEIDAATLRVIREGRAAFLDLEEAAPIADSVVTGRAVDLDPDVAAASADYVAKAATIDLDEAPLVLREAGPVAQFGFEL
jgi:hypothetical protein